MDISDYFERLFKTTRVVIEMKDYYNYPRPINYQIAVNVTSKVNVKRNEIIAVVDQLSGEIPETITVGMFGTPVPPQSINYPMNLELFRLEADSFLFNEDWNIQYEERLLNSLKENVRSFNFVDSYGKEREYTFNTKNIFIDC